MTELTQAMRPFCIGRFLIDVPAQAKSSGLSQSIMGMGQIEVEKNITRGAYQLRTSEREAELRAKTHEKEGPVLREVWRPEGVDGTLFFCRGDSRNTADLDVLACFWRDNQMYTFHYASPTDAVQKSKNELMRAFYSIQPRANDGIPQAAGACINGAFVPGGGYRSEHIVGSFEFPGHPRLRLAVSTGVTERPDTEGLLARNVRHTKAYEINYPGAKVRTLRNAKRTVNGADGEELIEVLAPDEDDPQDKGRGNTLNAVWEFAGVAKSMEMPELSVGLDHDDGAPDGKKLSEAEFLALWDAVVSSLRPRPGAF